MSAVLIFVAVLRLPALIWPVISDDEAIYDAMAHVMNSGGVMYRDTVDHKPPGLVFFYSLLERPFASMNPVAGDWAGIFAVHLFGVFLAVLTAYGLYLLAREFFERRPDLWLLPPFLYGVVTTAKCAYDGLAVNGELLMNAPTVFAILAVVWASKKRGLQRFTFDLLAGFLMGLAGLAKWQALVAGLAFPLLQLTSLKEFFKRVLLRGPAWIIGLLLPMIGAFLFFRAHDALPDAKQWGLYNLLYISEGPGLVWGLKRFGIQFGSVIIPSIVFYVCALVGMVSIVRGLRPGKQPGNSPGNLKDGSQIGLVVWALISCWAVGLGSRFFGHYFLQAELPLCLIAAEPLHRLWTRAPKTTFALIGVPAFAFFVFGLIPGLTHAIFDSEVPDWTHVGQEVAEKTRPDETLFVWGNAAQIYFSSHRRTGTRFSFCNLVTGLSPGTPSEYDPKASAVTVREGWPLLMSDLAIKRPVWILDTASAGWKGYGKFPIARYPEFQAYLGSHYRANGSVQGAVLYRRID